MEPTRFVTIAVLCFSFLAVLALAPAPLKHFNLDSWTKSNFVTSTGKQGLPLLSQLGLGEGTGNFPILNSHQVSKWKLPSALHAFCLRVTRFVPVPSDVRVLAKLGLVRGRLRNNDFAGTATSASALTVRSTSSLSALSTSASTARATSAPSLVATTFSSQCSTWLASKKGTESPRLQNGSSQSMCVLNWARQLASAASAFVFRLRFQGNRHGVHQENKEILVQRHARSLRERRSDLYSELIDNAFAAQGPFAWNPPPEKFLYLFCGFGQVSNRVMCFETFATLAGLFNRTLLINFNRSLIAGRYDRSLFFDLKHFRKCLGANTVMTFKEYRKKYHVNPKIDQVLCLPPYRTCPDDIGQERNLREYTRMNPWEYENIKSAPSVKRITVDTMDTTFLAELGRGEASAGRVLFIGEGFGLLIRGSKNGTTKAARGGVSAFSGGDLPFKRVPECPRGYLFRMHQDAYRVAALFVKEVLKGRPFVSAHLRRGASFAGVHGIVSIQTILPCFRRHIKDLKITTLFLATDAHVPELHAIHKAFHKYKREDPRIQLVQLRNPLLHGDWKDKRPKWVDAFQAAGWEGEGTPMVVVDKIICSMADVFLGTEKSTFTYDISRHRYGLGTANDRDRFICH
eukprot:TRINITY_DN235_c0_g2_i1.p1 TRINITY_DN235_c0_g2~~TRINITY_DN235_c0_g2_i1.p1  ORF type:complete len:629 (-),score=-13.27 TRINITY_DN235_c0_g2_i1:278-2164(-)